MTTTTLENTDKMVIDCWQRWRSDPIAFIVEVLDVKPEHVWSKMREVAESVRDNPRTAVAAGHSVSKTFLAPRIALWFLYCFPRATVVTTAPSHTQVEDQFWRELRVAHSNAKIPLGGNLTRTKLDLQDETGEKWFATGISTKPDTVTAEATKFQGYHNENVLVVFDEAAGVMTQIWKAAQYLLTGEGGQMRWLAQGNPTSDTGDFAEAIEPDSGWNVINISCMETPNYLAGYEVIPGVAGRSYVDGMREKYGEESNEWKIRILGQKPDFSESTFWGKELARAKAKDQLGFYPPNPTALVYTAWDIGSTHTVIWFFQVIQQSLRIIDFYYDSGGNGLPAHAALYHRKSTEDDYIYGENFVPWDVAGSEGKPSGPNAKSAHTGKYFIETAKELKVPMTAIDKYDREDQWRGGGDLIRLCQFHQPTVQEGWDGLCQYRRKLNATLATAEKPVYHKDPVKDWTEHVGSAWCTLAMAFRYHLKKDGMRVGYPGALPQHYPQHEPYDPFAGRGARDIYR